MNYSSLVAIQQSLLLRSPFLGASLLCDFVNTSEQDWIRRFSCVKLEKNIHTRNLNLFCFVCGIISTSWFSKTLLSSLSFLGIKSNLCSSTYVVGYLIVFNRHATTDVICMLFAETLANDWAFDSQWNGNYCRRNFLSFPFENIFPMESLHFQWWK